MDDRLRAAVLMQARRRRALAEQAALMGTAIQHTVSRAPARPEPAHDENTQAPLPGARHRRSSPEAIAAFFGRSPMEVH